MVPHARSPRSAAARAPGTSSRIQADLGRREVRVDAEPGQLAHVFVVPGSDKRVAGRGRPAILPDDGVVDRPARRPLPHDDGLALVGHADSREVGCVDPGLRDGGARGLELVSPDSGGVVLHPTGPREDLCERDLRLREPRAVAVEHDRARAGGPLVEREYVGHATSSTSSAGPESHNHTCSAGRTQ